ncbi:hypothetical protein LXA43DRAFT_1099482 [Ganoderma leucocontextum]|nr:hypothetical protein LXA43DRAFT_1099482 [Ganoderma leucocontextum]
MAQIMVSTKTYMIFASIFKVGHGARFVFSYNDFYKAMNELGFELSHSGDLVPKEAIGINCFVYARIGGKVKCATKVSKRIQDKWKRQLNQLYGWDATTFSPHK